MEQVQVYVLLGCAPRPWPHLWNQYAAFGTASQPNSDHSSSLGQTIPSAPYHRGSLQSDYLPLHLLTWTFSCPRLLSARAHRLPLWQQGKSNYFWLTFSNIFSLVTVLFSNFICSLDGITHSQLVTLEFRIFKLYNGILTDSTIRACIMLIFYLIKQNNTFFIAHRAFACNLISYWTNRLMYFSPNQAFYQIPIDLCLSSVCKSI